MRCTRTLHSSRNLIALGFLGLSLAIRWPFMSSHVFQTDAYGLCMAGLYTLTAQPPGYIGFGVLGWLINQLLDDINRSLVVLNVVASSLTSSVLYLLGRQLLGPKQAIIAAALFSCSVCSIYFAEVAVTYAVEGLVATSVAYSCWMAARTKSSRWLLFSGIILGLGSSVRQTTLMYMLPLWAYSMWKMPIGLGRKAIIATCLGASIAAWAIPNASLVERYWGQGHVGFLEGIYRQQMVSPETFDRTLISEPMEYHADAKQSFHWPILELGVSLYKVIAPSAQLNSPELMQASLKRAVSTILLQTLKVLGYSALGIGPLFLLLPVPLLLRKAGLYKHCDSRTATFLAVWITPAMLAFTLGHFGLWGYLMVVLGALCLATSHVVFELSRNLLTPFSLKLVVIGNCLISLCFFSLAPVLPGTTQSHKLWDVMLFQYTAAAIRQSFCTCRTLIARGSDNWTNPPVTSDELVILTAKRYRVPIEQLHPKNPVFKQVFRTSPAP